jgi:RNA polymerase sigma-70 factor (ECF subfamily)
VSVHLDEIVREHWWTAVATLYRLTGDLALAEDAVQEACLAAVTSWSESGAPANPPGWLIGVARHKALDRSRREVIRGVKEAAAMDWADEPSRPAGVAGDDWSVRADDTLALIFLCCHPALDPGVRVALTLRSVCGLTTTEIAAAFLVPEATMAKRLMRAKAKIRDAHIPFRVPTEAELPDRLAAVLRVVYLMFTEGHSATTGNQLVRPDLCERAIVLARGIVDLVPDDPEAKGLLALLLLVDARRAARTDDVGEIVLLEDQDRTRWDGTSIAEGDQLLVNALSQGRPGPYQLHAAIAACHSTAPSVASTDWRQIALLYSELLVYEPSAVVGANRAVAVAMAEGPSAGLVILDTVGSDPQLRRWPQLHIARADLLRQLGRSDQAIESYRAALELEPSSATRSLLARRLTELDAPEPA